MWKIFVMKVDFTLVSKNSGLQKIHPQSSIQQIKQMQRKKVKTIPIFHFSPFYTTISHNLLIKVL